MNELQAESATRRIIDFIEAIDLKKSDKRKLLKEFRHALGLGIEVGMETLNAYASRKTPSAYRKLVLGKALEKLDSEIVARLEEDQESGLPSALGGACDE